jgi:hypothetical protein
MFGTMYSEEYNSISYFTVAQIAVVILGRTSKRKAKERRKNGRKEIKVRKGKKESLFMRAFISHWL